MTLQAAQIARSVGATPEPGAGPNLRATVVKTSFDLGQNTGRYRTRILNAAEGGLPWWQVLSLRSYMTLDGMTSSLGFQSWSYCEVVPGIPITSFHGVFFAGSTTVLPHNDLWLAGAGNTPATVYAAADTIEVDDSGDLDYLVTHSSIAAGSGVEVVHHLLFDLDLQRPA